MDNLPYIRSSKESIVQYALNLKEKTFKDVLLNDPNITDEDRAVLFEYYNNPKSKGSLGQLIEKHFFFYDINNKLKALRRIFHIRGFLKNLLLYNLSCS